MSSDQIVNNIVSQERVTSGAPVGHGPSLEAVRILLARFLTDRQSGVPLATVDMFSPDGKFEWGEAPALRQIIQSPDDLAAMLHSPAAYQNALTIIEPWENVGVNPLGEPVRSSKNIAYIAKIVADCNAILLPVWSSGLIDLQRILALLEASRAIFVEGGEPSVYSPEQWSHPHCSQQDLFTLIEQLLIHRSVRSAPAYFICVGHQLAAQCHGRLLQKAVEDVLATEAIDFDPSGECMASLRSTCAAIRAAGESLAIYKRDGTCVARGWQDTNFTISPCRSPEVGERVLSPYTPLPHASSGFPLDMIHAYERTNCEDPLQYELSMLMGRESSFKIAMFHSDEVNEQAILFANWAYNQLHESIIPYRSCIALSKLAWLLCLPFGIQILACTEVNGKTETECSSTTILYKNFETGNLHYSFSSQFHPELLDDLRAFGERPAPSYEELKQSDGIRLLLRFMNYGMQG